MREDIVHRHTASAESPVGAHAGVAVLVIALFFFGVAEHIVSFCGLLEPFFGLLIARIFIRMVFQRELAVSLFDFGFRGIASYAQHIVIVFFCHGSGGPTAQLQL